MGNPSRLFPWVRELSPRRKAKIQETVLIGDLVFVRLDAVEEVFLKPLVILPLLVFPEPFSLLPFFLIVRADLPFRPFLGPLAGWDDLRRFPDFTVVVFSFTCHISVALWFVV